MPLRPEYSAELIHKGVWGEAIAVGLSTDDGSYPVGRSDGSVGKSDGTPALPWGKAIENY